MDILAQLLPSLKGGLVMALTTLLALYWTTDINLFARLAVIVLTGVVSYLGVLWWTERENLLQLSSVNQVDLYIKVLSDSNG